MSTSHQQRSLLSGLMIWLLVACFYALDYLQHTLPSVSILPIAQSLSHSYVDIANIMNIYFPVYAVCQIPAGYLIDRYGLKLSLSSACFVVSLGLLMMVIPQIYCLIGGRILIAAGSAFAFIGGLKAASLYLPDKLFPFMTGLLQSIGVIGGMLGQVLINHLILKTSWQHTFYLIGIFGLIWSMVLALVLTPKHRHKSPLDPESAPLNKNFLITLKAVIQNPSHWLLALYAMLMVGVVMSTFAETYNIIILEKLRHISSEHAAWLGSLIFIGVGVGAPCHGIISSRFKLLSLWMLLCSILTFACYALVPVALTAIKDINSLAILYFLLGFFVSSMLLVFSYAKQHSPPSQHATVFAFINTLIGLAGFIVPFIFGVLLHATNTSHHLHTAFMMPLLLLLIPLSASIIIAAFLYKKNRKQLLSSTA